MENRTEEYSIILLDRKITAQLTFLKEGVHVLLTGGDRTHVGAVSSFLEGKVQTMEYPGHRESVISAGWAATMGSAWSCPVTVACGIHYDRASAETIAGVLDAADKLKKEIMNAHKNCKSQ